MTTVLKATSRGQITLPAKWRKNFKTDRFTARIRERSIEIQPLTVVSSKTSRECTVFNAIRDNKGKGLKAKDLVRILKQTL